MYLYHRFTRINAIYAISMENVVVKIK